MPRLFFIAFLLSSLSFSAGVVAADAATLNVGIKIAPPFVIKDAEGSYSGISIDLWKEVAHQLKLDYRFQETDLKSLIVGLEQGSLDVSVAALTVTASRESKIDFTHPFHTTGLAIAVPYKGDTIWSTVKRLFSWKFLAVLAALGGLLLLVGFLLWLAERNKNSEMFGGSTARGIGASFWWAAVTMTTVGYGDKAPVTTLGRFIGLIWMFAAIIIISSFTAAIATSLTVSQLSNPIKNVNDLNSVRVATVESSASAEGLSHRGIGFVTRPSVQEAIKSMLNKEVDAVVYDKPILQYLAHQEYSERIQILPNTFDRQDYAFALPEGSDRREMMNQQILQIITSDEWRLVQETYLGKGNQ